MTANSQDLATSFRALADSAAFKLARDSMIDAELREALRTVKLGEGAVRIGDWDILARDENGQRVYNIRSKTTGDIVICDLVYYETARDIVAKLNAGVCHRSTAVQRLVQYNDEYARVRADVFHYEIRVDDYYDRGDARAHLIENRLSAAQRRAEILRQRLLERAVYI